MGRVPRWRMGKGIYHVINRGINNSWILSEDQDKSTFRDLLVKQRAPFKLNIYHYAIMDNHFHLAVEAINMRDLSSYIGSVCSLYSIYWHKKQENGRGPIWQGRFKSIPVQKEVYMNKLGRYIEKNPLMTGNADIQAVEEYQWSSASAYVLGKDDPLVEVAFNPYWISWGENDVERRQKYTDYLKASNHEDLDVFCNSGNIIGDDDFKAKVRSQGSRLNARSVGRPCKTNN